MRFSMKNLTALAAILTYSRKVVLASDDEMAAVCYDEDELAQILPEPGLIFDACLFKPEKTDARKCLPLDHLFDNDYDPGLKFSPTRISVVQPYTCYLFKSADCSGDYEQFLGGSETNVTTDYWGLRCDPPS